MTKPALPYVVGRIMHNLEEYALQHGDALADMVSDLLDADEDDRDGLIAGARAIQTNAKLLHILTLIARGDLAEAELASERLAQAKKDE